MNHLFCGQRCADFFNKGRTWEKYFRKLIQNTKGRQALNVPGMIRLFEKQGGRCALSGVELTKITGKGPVTTNASIDRIIPGGKYTFSNIRLVCTFVNGFRGNVSDKEFKWWCKRIVNNG